MRRLIYFIATTADGFIARRDGSYDFFSADPAVLTSIFDEYPETCPAHVRPVLGVTAAARHFDTVIMGAATHQPALDAGLTSAYPHLRQYVVTHRTDLPADPSLELIADDPLSVVRELKQHDGMDIWLCGGANLAAQLLDQIDEFHLKVNPVILGDGLPLIAAGGDPVQLSLRSSDHLGAGVLLNTYIRE